MALSPQRPVDNRLYFSISELCITPNKIPLHVANKLLKYHIWPMQDIRKMLNKPIWASQSSGYRPRQYEIDRGRSGNSQHVFSGKGAVDWTCEDVDDLVELLLEHSRYSRICWYPNNRFIHCDYKNEDKGRYYYNCKSPTSKWKLIHKI